MKTIYMQPIPLNVICPNEWNMTLSKTVAERDILPIFEKYKKDDDGMYGTIVDRKSRSIWNKIKRSEFAFVVKEVYIENACLCAKAETLGTKNGHLLELVGDDTVLFMGFIYRSTCTSVNEVTEITDICFFVDEDIMKEALKKLEMKEKINEIYKKTDTD